MPDSVIMHHLQGIPGITIKTRSGVHYTFNEHGEIEIPAHLAHIEGARGNSGHAQEFARRGHRHGMHPNHIRRIAEEQAKHNNAPVLHETATPEESDAVEQPQVDVTVSA